MLLEVGERTQPPLNARLVVWFPLGIHSLSIKGLVYGTTSLRLLGRPFLTHPPRHPNPFAFFPFTARTIDRIIERIVPLGTPTSSATSLYEHRLLKYMFMIKSHRPARLR